jgi:hypothetical protein
MNPTKTKTKTKKMKIKQILALGGAGLFSLSVAQAATITWTEQGVITGDSFLTLAGTTGNEVYGVDFGAGSVTTANGYTFADDYTGAINGSGPVSGNMTIPSISQYNGWLNGQTTGDAGLDAVLANAVYGNTSANPGTLNNLTIGDTYNVLAFLDDNRGSAAGGTLFEVNDGTAVSPTQLYGTYGSTPGNPLGGYLLGTFVADATTQAFTVQNNGQNGNFSANNDQFNGILVETAPVPEPGVCALLGAGVMMLLGLRRKK